MGPCKRPEPIVKPTSVAFGSVVSSCYVEDFNDSSEDEQPVIKSSLSKPTPLPSDALYWKDHPRAVIPGNVGSPSGMFHTHGRMRPGDSTAAMRWVMLFLLSYGSAMNQATCFSFAPFASMAATRYGNGVVANSEVIFFVAYIPMSFIGSYFVDRFGLRKAMIAACVSQTIGTWIRYSSSYFNQEPLVMYFGQVIASLGMCVFVNSPPRLSTSWFPSNERTLSTNIAVNANAAGAALAYIVGPHMVSNPEDFPNYNLAIAISCSFCLLLTYSLFKSHPKWDQEEQRESYDWGQWISVLKEKGFLTTVIVFSISECVINTMSTMLAKLVRPNGYRREEAGLLGAEYLLVCMAGGVIFGSLQHKWHLHTHLSYCLAACAVCMVVLRMTLVHPAEQQTVPLIISVFFASLFLGPLQATCNELGVESAFPVSENTVAAIQQLSGNFISSIFIPIVSWAHSSHASKDGPVGTLGHVVSWWNWWAMPEIIIAIMLLYASYVLYHYDGLYRRLTMEREIKYGSTGDYQEI